MSAAASLTREEVERRLRLLTDEEDRAQVEEILTGDAALRRALFEGQAALLREGIARDRFREALKEITRGAPLERTPNGWRCRYCGATDGHNRVCPVGIAAEALAEEELAR